MKDAYSLTPRQHEANALLGSDATHIMLFGGSRSGKTFLLIRAIVMRALKSLKSRHAILRYRLNHVKSSIVMDTFPKVMSLCFVGVPYTVNKSDLYAELPGGSQIWFGGLDDKERTEKILGQEHATVYLNECSQIPWSSRNLALTRLAQKCVYVGSDKREHSLKLRMYYDCNPPSEAHWAYAVFRRGIDPDTRRPLADPANYASMQMNPRDNTANLPADYLQTLEHLPRRMRLRFYEGQFGSVTENALWSIEQIDTWRTDEAIDMQRIVVAVDPSGAGDSDNVENDEIGIMVCGLGIDGNGYVLEDCTVKCGPAKWGRVATSAFERHMANTVVGEVNFGGEMVKHVIQTARPGTPYKAIHASRGKVIRAEPISALYETGKIRHCGSFPELEEELCSFTAAGYLGERSPNRADAAIHAFSELFPGMTKPEPVARPARRQVQTYRGTGAWMA